MTFLHNDREQFQLAIEDFAKTLGLRAWVIEKDYYVTLTLRALSERFDFVVFKGGTSLSKCHNVISRFSEDIDIAISRPLSQGEKKKLKYGIADIASGLGMTIPNLESTRSRRDRNVYKVVYDSVIPSLPSIEASTILLETSFWEPSFPTDMMPVHSYIGDALISSGAEPSLLEEYGLLPFEMKVQSLERTLVDKVFAICDYYLKGNVRRYSRHIYDIYKISPLVEKDEAFIKLIEEVRVDRMKTPICPSTEPGNSITDLLGKLIAEETYKSDYNNISTTLLTEKVSYEEAITAVVEIMESGMFG